MIPLYLSYDRAHFYSPKQLLAQLSDAPVELAPNTTEASRICSMRYQRRHICHGTSQSLYFSALRERRDYVFLIVLDDHLQQRSREPTWCLPTRCLWNNALAKFSSFNRRMTNIRANLDFTERTPEVEVNYLAEIL